ncbi:TPA: hypothetical protein ACVOYQ_003927 [Vibrio alginolyticus]|uniref:hypothetical protein n=1 Tax=Vibrio alginolyticus TaxID=663 RepID=UPI00215C6F63|nr:hypothetical protein [Vibrio alginolyticus]MCR9439846.1 hypothetical protein [Vibrio alginolyticus]
MGTLIRLIGSQFTNPDLPLAQIPYGGIRSGLLGAYHLRYSMDMCRDLSGNGNHPQVRGSVNFEGSFIKTGDGKNGFTTPIPHNDMQQLTFCSIIRRPIQASASYGFGVNTYGVDGSTGGVNIMGNNVSSARHQVHIVDPNDPDNVSSLVKDYPTVGQNEWVAAIVTVDAEVGEVKGYFPKISETPYLANFSTPIVHSTVNPNVLIGYSESTSNCAMDNAYAAIFDRALTPEEVATQYASMMRYAEAVGLGTV